MSNLLVSWAMNHQEFLIGIAAGAVGAHLGPIVAFAFHSILKVPYVGAWIRSNPDRAKAIAAEVLKDVDEQIDDAAKSSQK